MDASDTTGRSSTDDDNVPKTGSLNAGGLEHTQNPLLIPEIIEQLVRHLKPDFEELKKLRLVCKVWTETTQLMWRSSAAVVVYPDSVSRTRKRRLKNGLTVSQLLTQLQNFEGPYTLFNNPFSKYVLKDFMFDLQEWSNSDGEEALFRDTVGPLMKHLHLSNCVFANPVSSQSAKCPIVQLLASMTPNIKHLTLSDLSLSEDGPDYYFDKRKLHNFNIASLAHLQTLEANWKNKYPMDLNELLELATGLEVLIGQGYSNQHLLMTIAKVRFGTSPGRNMALSKLKHVDVMNFWSNYHFVRRNFWEFLVPPNGSPDMTQVPLETLFLHLHDKWNSVHKLDTYVNSLSGTLKTFKAFRPPVVELGRSYIQFLRNVSMPLLKEICFWGNIASDLGFLINTPNLEKLKIDFGCFEIRDIVNETLSTRNFCMRTPWKYQIAKQDMIIYVGNGLMNSIFCYKMNHFEIDYEFSGENLKTLQNWMPNLKTLKSILNSSTIPVVCEGWQSLNELVCLHESKLENSDFVREDDMTRRSSRKTICDLKNLERFQFDSYCFESKLTDDAVFKGFLKMACLKFVQISVHSSMSSAAEKALRDSTVYCKIVRSGPTSAVGNMEGESSGLLYCKCDRCVFRRRAEA